MNRLMKRFWTTMALCLMTLLAYSQVWTAQDSLHLKKLLDSDQELHLNMDAVKSIDFGGAVGSPGCRRRRIGCCLTNRCPKHCLNRKWC